jgi:hypothetical protein
MVLLAKLTVPQLIKKFPTFMKLDCSLPLSKRTTICAYPEPDQSSIRTPHPKKS